MVVLNKHKSKNSEFTTLSLKGGKWNIHPENVINYTN